MTDIALDYSRTLQLWRTRFLAQADAVRAMGFDDRFLRTWDYYLAISEAGFRTGTSQDLQIVFEKGRGLEPRRARPPARQPSETGKPEAAER